MNSMSWKEFVWKLLLGVIAINLGVNTSVKYIPIFMFS
jgi:dolichyl-phosphate-mannose--protein O-mannosyl transferase